MSSFFRMESLRESLAEASQRTLNVVTRFQEILDQDANFGKQEERKQEEKEKIFILPRIVENPKERALQLWIDKLRNEQFGQGVPLIGKDALGKWFPLLSLVMAYCGNVPDLVHASMVNRQWYKVISTDRKLWKWCVRWGELSEKVRPGFWLHCTGTRVVIDRKVYRSLIKGGIKSDYKHQIIVDVGRTFNFGSCHITAPMHPGMSNVTFEDLVASSIPEGYSPRHHHHSPQHKKQVAQDQEKDMDPEGNSLARGAPPEGLTEEEKLQFEHKRNMQRRLTNILLATTTRHPDVGYCQGMNFVVAGLYAAFAQKKPFGRDPSDRSDLAREQTVLALFHRLLWHYGLIDMYKPGLAMLRMRCWQFIALLDAFLPKIHMHMEQQGVIPEMFAVGWFQTIFMYMDSMPFTTIRRIWDIFFFERDWKIIFRVGLALLKLIENRILSNNIDNVLRLLDKYPTELIADSKLVCTALSFKLTRKQIKQLQQRWEEENPKDMDQKPRNQSESPRKHKPI